MALIPVVLVGCGSSSENDTSDACVDSNNADFNCATMLNNVVDNVVIPTVNNLVSSLSAQESSLTDYCGEISNADKKAAAQDDWHIAMTHVQQLAVMQFGPLENETTFAQIYSWPSFGATLYDAEIVNYDNAADQENYTISSGAARKGLIALEYILFTEDGHFESDSSTVTSWASGKTDQQIQQARCDYGLLVVEDLIDKAEAIQTDWNDFDIVAENSSLQDAANDISDALFYIDKQTKDAKLKEALPQDSQGTFDASELESQFAFVSKAHLKNNLLGAQALLSGNDGLGLNAYLSAKGQSDLAEDMITSLEEAIANVDAIVGDFQSAVAGATDVPACINASSYENSDSDITKLCALQSSVKAFTDLLKADFVLALSFAKPAEADGDND